MCSWWEGGGKNLKLPSEERRKRKKGALESHTITMRKRQSPFARNMEAPKQVLTPPHFPIFRKTTNSLEFGTYWMSSKGTWFWWCSLVEELYTNTVSFQERWSLTSLSSSFCLANPFSFLFRRTPEVVCNSVSSVHHYYKSNNLLYFIWNVKVLHYMHCSLTSCFSLFSFIRII